MTLKQYINDNINEGRDMFYNEEFCNLTLEYIGSYVGGIEDFKKIDIDFLNSQGYDVMDFLECN